MTSYLDASTYHVFGLKGRCVLYDLGRQAVLEVSAVVCDALRWAGQHPLDELTRRFCELYPEMPPGTAQMICDELRDQGLFQYRPATVKEDEKSIRVLLRHKPRRIQLLVSQACNMACKYCYAEANDSNARGRLMTAQMARDGVDFLVRRSGRRPYLEVMFFGGEPLLNFPVIKSTVEYCKRLEPLHSKRFSFQTSTNGTLLTDEIQDFLCEHEFATLVSLDGDAETHNLQRPMRDGSPSFDRVIANARSLVSKCRARRPPQRVKIRANLTSWCPGVERAKLFLEREGFDSIGIAAINSPAGTEYAGAFGEAEGLALLKDTDRILVQDVLDRLAAGLRPHPYASDRIAKQVKGLSKACGLTGIRCGVGRNTLAVDCDGHLYPCHRYAGMEPYILGNIYTGLDGRLTRRYYEALVGRGRQRCARCWARLYCGGGCPWEMSMPDGQIGDMPEYICDLMRASTERSLWLYVELKARFPKVLDGIMNGRARPRARRSPGPP